MKGPKIKGEKIHAVPERELVAWRKNVAHLILFGKSKMREQRKPSPVKTSTMVRVSRDRKAIITHLAHKSGMSERALVDLAIDRLLVS
jgi:hypothetical protein